MQSFNGTTVTRFLRSRIGIGGAVPNVMEIFVTPDDTVWMLDSDGVLRSSTDLVTWTDRMRIPQAVSTTFSFIVHDDFVYIGDRHDQIWRAKVTS